MLAIVLMHGAFVVSQPDAVTDVVPEVAHAEATRWARPFQPRGPFRRSSRCARGAGRLSL